MTEALDDARLDELDDILRYGRGPWAKEAADTIADLRAQIERLTAINAEQATTIGRMMRRGAAA